MLGFIKLSARIAFWVITHTVFPILRLLLMLTGWKGREKEFCAQLLSDPEIEGFLVRNGLAPALMQLRAALQAMPNAPKMSSHEDMKWGKFIMEYGANPRPDMVPDYLDYLSRVGTTGSTELPTFGAVYALLGRHPELEPCFSRHAALVDDLSKRAAAAEPDRPGWNDFYMARWFVLREDDDAACIARRTTLPGMVGSTCRWMANSVAEQMPEFREALERGGYDFAQPDMRAAIVADDKKEEHFQC